MMWTDRSEIAISWARCALGRVAGAASVFSRQSSGKESNAMCARIDVGDLDCVLLRFDGWKVRKMIETAVVSLVDIPTGTGICHAPNSYPHAVMGNSRMGFRLRVQ